MNHLRSAFLSEREKLSFEIGEGKKLCELFDKKLKFSTVYLTCLVIDLTTMMIAKG